MWHSILHLLREMKGCIRHSIVLSRGISKRCRPLLEQLESRETPSGSPVLVAASYADKSIYALDPVSGKMLATLVAPILRRCSKLPRAWHGGPTGTFTSAISKPHPFLNTTGPQIRYRPSSAPPIFKESLAILQNRATLCLGRTETYVSPTWSGETLEEP